MNTITFFAPSGSPASSNHTSLVVIQQLTIPGDTSGANRVGFFGNGGPEGVPFAVIVDRYQDKTYITNMSGTNLGKVNFGFPGSGQLINNKYISSTTASISGLPETSLTNVTANSGTVLIRFIPSGSLSVRTQNAILYTVALNASSGVDNITTLVTGLKMQCYEPAADSIWTQTAGAGAISNQMGFNDHNTANTVHDFFVGLSCSPEATGERNNFGFFMVVEFL